MSCHSAACSVWDLCFATRQLNILHICYKNKKQPQPFIQRTSSVLTLCCLAVKRKTLCFCWLKAASSALWCCQVWAKAILSNIKHGLSGCHSFKQSRTEIEFTFLHFEHPCAGSFWFVRVVIVRLYLTVLLISDKWHFTSHTWSIPRIYYSKTSTHKL